MFHCLLAWLISDEMPPISLSSSVNNVCHLIPLPPSTFITFPPFITCFKQLGYDVPWYSFLYISYAWVSLQFLVRCTVFKKSNLEKICHYFFKYFPCPQPPHTSPHSPLDTNYACARPYKVVPGGATSAGKEQKLTATLFLFEIEYEYFLLLRIKVDIYCVMDLVSQTLSGCVEGLSPGSWKDRGSQWVRTQSPWDKMVNCGDATENRIFRRGGWDSKVDLRGSVL